MAHKNLVLILIFLFCINSINSLALICSSGNINYTTTINNDYSGLAWNRSTESTFLSNSSDNVGIGVINPSEKLNVSGNVGVAGWVNAINYYLNATSIYAIFSKHTDLANNFTRLVSDIENATIIRDYNTTWIKKNQDLNSTEDIYRAVYLKQYINSSSLNSSADIAKVKVNNASYSDDSSMLGGQEAGYYLDNTDGNCSVDGSCSLICYDSELGNYLNLSGISTVINNDTIVRDYNTTWIKKNQNINTTQDILNAVYFKEYINSSGLNTTADIYRAIYLKQYINSSGLNSSADIAKVKVNNATWSDDSSKLGGQSPAYYLDNTDGNCSVSNSCSLVVYDSDLVNIINTSNLKTAIDNDTVVRDYNVTWIKKNQFDGNCSGKNCEIGWGNLTGVPSNLGSSNETTRVNLIIDTYIPNNATRLINIIDNNSIIRSHNTSWLNETEDIYRAIYIKQYLNASGLNTTADIYRAVYLKQYINLTKLNSTTDMQNALITPLLNLNTSVKDWVYTKTYINATKLNSTTDMRNAVLTGYPDLVSIGSINTSLLTEIKNTNTSVKNWVASIGYYSAYSNFSTTINGAYVNRSLWTSIDHYPAACGAGEFVTAIGDTLTCDTPVGGGASAGDKWLDNGAWISPNSTFASIVNASTFTANLALNMTDTGFKFSLGHQIFENSTDGSLMIT